MKHSRSAFSLVEILVVLGIAAIVSAITLGGFSSVKENRKTSCQANLSQIYQASRQYSQDYSGKFPYRFDEPLPTGVSDSNTPKGGRGLWLLYAFANNGADPTTNNEAFANPVDSNQLSGYVRSPKVFHCPNDSYQQDVLNGITTTSRLTSQMLFQDGTNSMVNPLYLSYQGSDDKGGAIYSNYRAPYDSTPLARRQLGTYTVSGTSTKVLDRTPDTDTILTWCRFHRSLNSTGATVEGKRNFDNVLFYDGSIQFIPMYQDTVTGQPCTTPDVGNCAKGWRRTKRILP